MAITNLRAANNVTFQLTRDFSAVAAIYNMATAVVRMQARVSPDAPDPPAYEWVTGGTQQGSVTFDATTNLCVFAAPLSQMEQLDPGYYVHDCRLELASGVVIPLFKGALTLSEGVTSVAAGSSSSTSGGGSTASAFDFSTGLAPLNLL